MELVIRIEDATYNMAKMLVDNNHDNIVEIPLSIIVNGVPLPKGHGRLIDADGLNRKDVNCANVPMNFIDTAPTIIEADKAESEESNDKHRI